MKIDSNVLHQKTARNERNNNNQEKAVKSLRGIAVTALATAALTLGSPISYSQDDCTSDGNHTIQVTEGADGRPALSYRGGSAESVHVCLGDQVQWVLTGSDRDFFVDFFSGAPFDGAAKRGSSGTVVSIVIGGPAQRGASYSYGVEFDGGPPLDPHIIVD